MCWCLELVSSVSKVKSRQFKLLEIFANWNRFGTHWNDSSSILITIFNNIKFWCVNETSTLDVYVRIFEYIFVSMLIVYLDVL